MELPSAALNEKDEATFRTGLAMPTFSQPAGRGAEMSKRTVIIAGATGLVGRELLSGLLADPSVEHVHAVGRRAPAVVSPKLTAHAVDFAALPALPAADELYLALGTTIKVAGSQAAFRAVDHDANLAVAKAALASGAKRVGLVSAMGADAKSRVFYSRVKGELEQDLAALPFAGVVIARPSLLVGARAELGQPDRPGEEWGNRLNKLIGFLIPANYKPIMAADVAHALLETVPSVDGVRVLLSGAMRR
ncbi:nucleoside-diphosphate sugar epimerase [Bradyrhizobium aeschynomenes]|uniref:nucleoside-diphosphate sugar epimerase n=1 Tax=Bradyrhizobium aeschynomenes TaxID=2734909 RepID=UPI001FEF9D04|nr:nucleoside-diphosphate sugar epimerase [Bradyrhizobium aeschynomenes]